MDDYILFFADSHCHLDVECTSNVADKLAEYLNSLELICKDNFFHIMSSSHVDIYHLELILDKLNKNVIFPYFGIHPWYSHLFTTLERHAFRDKEEWKLMHYESVLDPKPLVELLQVLPNPIHIDLHLEEIERLVKKYQQKGHSCGIGEIGLDKLFKIPLNGYFGNQKICLNSTPKKLSDCRVRMGHQEIIFSRQLKLASTLKRPVSLHCVKAHGSLYQKVAGDDSTSGICSIILHSYSGSLDQAKLWVRNYAKSSQQVYFSLSNWINGSANKRSSFDDLVRMLPDLQILLETDVGIDRYLLDLKKREDYYQQLLEIFDKICSIKGWDKLEARKIVHNNWTDSIAR